MLLSAQADIFATKGIEYLLVIGYLLVLIPFWLILSRAGQPGAVRRAAARVREAAAGWFSLPEGIFVHPGHAWAKADEGDVLRIGLDDFAGKLVGRPESFVLPKPGAALGQGEPAWQMAFAGRSVPMLSPVGGAVVAVNEAVLSAPELVTRDPYGAGWLLKVRVANAKVALKNLLHGSAATLWMQDTVERLQARMGGELGEVMQDGGVPVSGFVRDLDPEQWEQVAAEFFLTD